MGTTLTGTTPQDTYDSLIKVTDNGPLSGSLKTLTDGLGNDSALALSTTAASITGSLTTTAKTLAERVQVGTAASLNDVTGVGNTLQFANYSPSAFVTGSADSYIYKNSSVFGGLTAQSLVFQTRSDLTGGGFAFVAGGTPAVVATITGGGNVGIGTSTPAAKLDVLGTTFLRDNLNAGKTANINVTTAVNGTGGGNREFTTFTGASATGFTGTDATDQGFGYFAATIVSGRSYEVSATMVVTNGNPLSFITSTGRNFATDTVQTVQSSPVSNTTYRFVATGNASFFGISASNTGGGMTCVVSNFSLKEVGSVLVTSDSNVGVGTTSPAVPLDVVGNIRSSTGILFGSDTAAANALDDYEEGTWTMGVTFGGASVGVTTAYNTGTYTKIGRQVTVNGYLALSNKGSSTGTAKITGLPFTIANTTGNLVSAALRFDSITFTNQFQGYGGDNSTTISLEEITILGAVTVLTDADFSNSCSIMVSLTYFV